LGFISLALAPAAAALPNRVRAAILRRGTRRRKAYLAAGGFPGASPD